MPVIWATCFCVNVRSLPFVFNNHPISSRPSGSDRAMVPGNHCLEQHAPPQICSIQLARKIPKEIMYSVIVPLIFHDAWLRPVHDDVHPVLGANSPNCDQRKYCTRLSNSLKNPAERRDNVSRRHHSLQSRKDLVGKTGFVR